jgi:hypothetical protein
VQLNLNIQAIWHVITEYHKYKYNENVSYPPLHTASVTPFSGQVKYLEVLAILQHPDKSKNNSKPST